MKRELPPEAWKALLHTLDPKDENQAAEAYLDLQDRLVRYFEWKRTSMPEDLAFETLRRVALRCKDGVELTTSMGSFALGFAHRVFQEQWRQPTEFELSERDIDRRSEEAATEETDRKEELARCLDSCAKANPEAYDLLLRFHQYEGKDRIEYRKKLAVELGKTPNALRIEAFRRRKDLRSCVDQCMDGTDLF